MNDSTLADGITRRDALRGGAGVVLGIGALGGMGGLLSACGSSSSGSSAVVKPKPDGDITWFTWESYIEPKVLAAFEKRYGVKVKQVYFDNPETMLAKVAAGLPYDLITTNSAFLKRMIEGNLLRPFEPSELNGWDNIIPYFRNPIYDHGSDRYSIPYAYGPAGIAYQPDKVHVTGSWNDLWENEEAAGHIYLIDEMGETLTMSLIRLGYDLNSGDTSQVTKAADELLKVKPSLAAFSSNLEAEFGGGNAWLSHAWGGTTLQVLKTLPPQEAEKWSFEWPSDGLSMGCDTLSVGTNAKSPGSALTLIQFMLQPENSAANVDYTGYPNGTEAGNAAYKEATKDFPFLYLETNPKEFKWRESPTGSRLTLWNEQWARVTA
ncbi:MAG: spermidine/putrescine ABC transporter substrate-binding protein [Actinobacteria bacterium]|nr:spermidine/putrescine ABC transporter substrate-binding protein [Actinomycetota bacterium]